MNDNIKLNILTSLSLLRGENEYIEVRVMSGKKTYSGYFNSDADVISELEKNLYSGSNIYVTLNPTHSGVGSRSQAGKMIEVSSKNTKTTSDADISKRRWIMIDIDPERPSEISSSDEEKKVAHGKAVDIYNYLKSLGFEEPVFCDSGNGWHLLYMVDMPNDTESHNLVKDFLSALAAKFDGDGCKVDKTVFNASRITKLYGTLSVKGKHTEERPHRWSLVKKIPQKILPTKTELVKSIVSFHKPNASTTNSAYSGHNNGGGQSIDVEGFMSKHGIAWTSSTRNGNSTIYTLENCLFNPEHKGKDAVIISFDNGGAQYKCLHSSCSNYGWRDVRMMFESDFYDRKRYNERQNNHVRVSELPKPPKEGKKFKKMSEIKKLDRSKIVSMPSGFTALDSKIIGFNKGEVSIWSGKNGSAKSTVLSQICVNSVNIGLKCAIYSGELQAHRFKDWIHLQCAGRKYSVPTQYENLFRVDDGISELIDEWIGDSMLLYDNDFGKNFYDLMDSMRDAIRNDGVDFIVLDNIMSIDLAIKGLDKNASQTNAILEIVSLAKKENVHVHIVAHPRKSNSFLRKDDISGSSDLTNAVENVFICHRNNRDFEKAVTEFLGGDGVEKFKNSSNVIEVCKNRDLGVEDLFIGLHYENESKRLNNYPQEDNRLGWEKLIDESKKRGELNFQERAEVFFNTIESGSVDLPF